ncbi:nitrite reductase [Vibrio sp. Hep-1b-8]|nr:nitrite reductase [Vibrio sp. Hep-1b-8]
MKRTLIASLMLAIPLSLWWQGDKPSPYEPIEQITSSDWMSSLQQQLKQDPNQAELWFQLGHGYMNKQEFLSALTCFDYTIRLSDTPSASQLAAKASALYYLEKQVMTDEVDALLAQALNLEPNNLTALALMAGDHFISLRYQQAIDIWTQMLDSNSTDLDRVSIIHSLNQVKGL